MILKNNKLWQYLCASVENNRLKDSVLIKIFIFVLLMINNSILKELIKNISVYRLSRNQKIMDNANFILTQRFKCSVQHVCNLYAYYAK